MTGRTIVLTSGKGGVGKTTATANIGTALAMRGQKVVVIDTDIGLRNLDVIMGLENRIAAVRTYTGIAGTGTISLCAVGVDIDPLSGTRLTVMDEDVFNLISIAFYQVAGIGGDSNVPAVITYAGMGAVIVALAAIRIY